MPQHKWHKEIKALRMAIEVIEAFGRGCDCDDYFMDIASTIDACKEALEPTVAELNDEYLRDTHVEGMPKDGDCCTEGCIKCDARKVLAETQEPVAIEPVAWTWLDNGVDMFTTDKDYVEYVEQHVPVGKLYTTPSREWQSLSDRELFNLSQQCDLNHILGLIDYGRAVEAKLKEKNEK